MVDEQHQSETAQVAIYNEDPPPHVPHVRNFLRYFGSILARYRNGLSAGEKSSQRMAERLAAYTGSPVSRQRVVRAESGDERISMDVYAAILDEMKAWPDILWALEKGAAHSARFALLVERELSEDISQAHKDGLKRLRQKQSLEAMK